MHTIYSTRYQSPERCMELSRFAKAQLSPDYLSSHISNSVEIREIGKFLKEVKINQEMIKIIKKKPDHLEATRQDFLFFFVR